MPTVDVIKRNEGRNLCSRIEKDEAFVNKQIRKAIPEDSKRKYIKVERRFIVL
jgi:hypothetical protein